MTAPTTTPTSAIRTRSASRKAWLPWVLGASGIVGLLLIFEIVSRLSIVPEQFLPRFSNVFIRVFTLFGDPGFLVDLWTTAFTWFLGLLISAVVAIPLGVLLGLSAVAYRATRFPIELIRALPAVALIPLAMALAGQSLQMQLIVSVYASIWPILFNTMYGVRGVDPKVKDMGRVFGLSKAAVIRRIVIPSAAPFIATGIRIASSITLIVVVTIGLLAGFSDGLGAFMSLQRELSTPESYVNMFAAIVITGIFGLAINSLLGWAERKWFGWDATTRNAK